MNPQKSVSRSSLTKFGSVVAVVSALALSWQSAYAAVPVVLVDANSDAFIDPYSQAGMYDWRVEGQDQLNQQWFWYRIGSAGPEASIDAISAPTIVQPNLRQATILYSNPIFSIQIDYLLSGGAAGSGRSDVSESIRIINKSTATLDFHFFQYSDFDLGGAGNDSVRLGQNLAGKFNEAVLSDPLVAFTETVTVPGANHGEAAFFDTTRLKLNDAGPTTLNDVAGPIGPGDVTWAFQWDLSIAPGGSVLISKDKYLELTTIPEPATALLGGMSLGLLLMIGRARRNRAF